MSTPPVVKALAEIRRALDTCCGKKGGDLHQRMQQYVDTIEARIQSQDADMLRTMAELTPTVSALPFLSPPDRQLARELIAAGRRAKAQHHHPDHGGDGRRMARLNAVADRLERLLGGV